MLQTGKARSRGRVAGTAAAIAAAIGWLALTAASSADPVTGGRTVLKPDQDTFEALADMSIGVEATGAAKFGNRARFPIKGGDVKAGPRGEIDHRGGLAFFTEGGPGIKFSKFTVRIGKKKAKLFAKAGSGANAAEARFLDLNLRKATIGGSAGVNLTIKGAEATLARQGAGVLEETFDFPFRKGIPVGVVKVKANVG